MGKQYGTDGIRGVVGENLTADLAFRTGKAIAAVLKEEKGRKPVITIGKDTRISSDMLESALIAGICSVGGDVMQSAQAVGRPSAMGLCMAWVLVLIGVAIVFGIRWIARRTGAQRAATTHPRTIVPRKPIQPTTKKEHDDQHESTDTTGSGVRLP